jgi:hypothetical protein
MGWVVSITPLPRFTPGERTPGTHCTGGWVGPRAGLDTDARGKTLCPRRGSNLDRPVVQPVVRHYTAWANLAHCCFFTSRNNLFLRGSSTRNGPVYAVFHDETFFAPEFQTGTCQYIPYPFILLRLFLTVYPCTAFNKYTGTYKSPFRACGVNSTPNPPSCRTEGPKLVVVR